MLAMLRKMMAFVCVWLHHFAVFCNALFLLIANQERFSNSTQFAGVGLESLVEVMDKKIMEDLFTQRFGGALFWQCKLLDLLLLFCGQY
jgi:hypothetical protein